MFYVSITLIEKRQPLVRFSISVKCWQKLDPGFKTGVPFPHYQHRWHFRSKVTMSRKTLKIHVFTYVRQLLCTWCKALARCTRVMLKINFCTSYGFKIIPAYSGTSLKTSSWFGPTVKVFHFFSWHATAKPGFCTNTSIECLDEVYKRWSSLVYKEMGSSLEYRTAKTNSAKRLRIGKTYWCEGLPPGGRWVTSSVESLSLKRKCFC